MHTTDSKTDDACDALNVHVFRVPHEHPALPGHFPGNPVVPGVLVLEQVVMLIEAKHGPLPAMRLPQVKFLQPLLPGQEARVEVTTRGQGSWRFRILRDDMLLASGDIVATGPAA